MMIRQNKWRASRFGLEAELIDPFSCDPHPVRDIVSDLVVRLHPIADQLQCQDALQRVLELSKGQSWADRQLTVLRNTGNEAEVVRHFTELSRVSAAK
jgi:carboxylate-amine ligase